MPSIIIIQSKQLTPPQFVNQTHPNLRSITETNLNQESNHASLIVCSWRLQLRKNHLNRSSHALSNPTVTSNPTLNQPDAGSHAHSHYTCLKRVTLLLAHARNCLCARAVNALLTHTTHPNAIHLSWFS